MCGHVDPAYCISPDTWPYHQAISAVTPSRSACRTVMIRRSPFASSSVTDADPSGLGGQSTGRGAGRRTGAIGGRLLQTKAGDHRARAQARVNRVDQEQSVVINEANVGAPLLAE